jgi:hypothetical protein
MLADLVDRLTNPNPTPTNKNMEIANCEVRLLGDLANSVPKTGVTPAEAAILQAIHGAESVVRVEITGNDRRSHQQEYARLAEIYGNSPNTDGEKIFYKIFPQTFDPRLPSEFKQVGITVTGADKFSPVPDLPDAADAPDPDAEFFDSEPEKPAKNKK